MNTQTAQTEASDIDETTVRLLSAGLQLFRTHQFEVAGEAFSRILKLHPDIIQANLMMGMILYNLRQYEQAKPYLEKVLLQEPDHINAQETLANIEFYSEHYEAAQLLFEPIVVSRPDNSDAHHRLSVIHFKAERYDKALLHINAALDLKPSSHVYWTAVMDMYRVVPMLKLDSGIIDHVIRILKEGSFFSPSIIRLTMHFVGNCSPLNQLPLHDLVNTPLKKINPDWFTADMIEHLESPVFIQMLQSLFISTPLIEYVFVGCRRFFLLQHASLDELALKYPFLLTLLSAFGMQGMLGDFAHITTPEEIERLNSLWKTLEEKTSFEPSDALIIAVLSSYRPLYKLGNVAAIGEAFAAHDNPEFQSLLRVQVNEPLEEFAIMKDIPSLSPIVDEVSQKVEAQYMEHPYPRWNFSQRVDPTDINQYVYQIFGYLRSELPYLPSDRTLDLLVAGCGTGKHSLTCSFGYKNVDVLAIDLSKASMAYAIRKTREAEVKNIRYLQADILDLDKLEQQFDIVESAGVLHHMRDPMAGWQKITDRLKPNGLMKIGLYSTTARKAIYEARAEIQTLNYSTDEDSMRAFRRHIMELPANHSMKRVMLLRDFYNLAECRDLLFHVQEHTFTIPQIKTCIAQLGLRFLGFEFLDYAILANFNKRFDDPKAIRSLDAWHEFEQENPDTFKSMYQFWLRKDA